MATHEVPLVEPGSQPPLIVLVAGDPAVEKLVLVHRCCGPGIAKPDKCGCTEKISESEASEWIRSERADWLASDRNGRRYVRRGSIVVRATEDEVAAQRDAQKRAAAHKRSETKKENSIREIITSLRNHLTIAQNARYTNSQLLKKLRNASNCDWYVNGLEARRKMMLAIEGKTGRALEAVLASRDYVAWAEALRLKQDLVHVSQRYHNKILAWARLGMKQGVHLAEAPKGKGELVYAGLEHDLALIDDGDQEKESE